MTFPSGFLDEVRARVTVSSVVGRAVRLVRAGKEFKAPCPFHKEKTPSFTVNDQKGFYHCFGCGAHGDIVSFLMQNGNLSFLEAVERLAAEAGLEVPKATPQEKEKFEQQKTLYDLLEKATQWFEYQLRTTAGRPALDYLHKRGLNEETLTRFRLGYAPLDSQALKTVLTKQGFSLAQMVEAGLIKSSEDGREPYSFFRHRVMFPVADRRGRVVAFGARLMEGEGPKYINSPDTPLFHKGQLLYGLSRARQAAGEGKTVIVAEGYMDVISLVEAGFTGAVAPLGTALTETQIQELWKLVPGMPKTPVLCFDGDNAGRRAAFRAVTRALPLLKPDQSFRIAFLPEGQDPDSLIKTQGAKAMQSVVDAALPLVDVLWDMEVAARPVKTPEDRAGLQKALEVHVQSIADSSVQTYYRSEVRGRLDRTFGWQSRFTAKRFQKQKAAVTVQRTKPLPVAQKHQYLLLAILFHHPQLFSEVGEALAQESFTGPLEELRTALVQVLEENEIPDSVNLQERLHPLGLMAFLEKVLQHPTVALAPFAGPKATLEKARAGWQHIWDMKQKIQLKENLRSLGHVMAQDLTPETAARMAALTEEMNTDLADQEDSG